ncbi:hypothetical protein CSW46_07450 [Thermus scotoductus]|uniref:M20/M25/M40 family metallo-hydrolase n=1 Tax=Thermus scotoductus TaxID=37636 RepID=UPI000F7E9041|nr:M20/M25/M40 family metallo-hydrolase [Thermus scotoductus]RTH09545.1 hypothetical protein CSW46_07450 [Thermus scotoductus]
MSEPLLVKVGGSLRGAETLLDELASYPGPLVLVHGGGPEIGAWLTRLGLESRFEGGLRVTPPEHMEVVEMSLCLTGKRLAEGLSRLHTLFKEVGGEASLNASGLRGGEAVNAIPKEASALLEIRALEEEALRTLYHKAQEVLEEAAQLHGVEVSLEVLGTRPAGSTATPRLLQAAGVALAKIGERPQFQPGSTDASAAIERGIAALALGVYRGGGAHTPEEWVLPQSLWEGREVLLAFLKALGVG